MPKIFTLSDHGQTKVTLCFYAENKLFSVTILPILERNTLYTVLSSKTGHLRKSDFLQFRCFSLFFSTDVYTGLC